MKTLEEILQEHFHCKKPFLVRPKKLGGGAKRHLTLDGEKAYAKLYSLLLDLAHIGAFEGGAFCADDITDKLDSIIEKHSPY